MDYSFSEIEKKWQAYWKANKTYKTENKSEKPKYYVLDMFPYPSGAGLHVGHPLGYIASDIYTRYKRHKGFNVLHPMGYDAYGLPAEQYAIQTGQHPAITTEKNIARYREQLDKIGFSFDWDREVRTCNPDYYKWTQWTFIQLFNHYYNNKTNKAESIAELVKTFEKEGNINIDANCSETPVFTADEWKSKSEKQQQETLLNYRLAYLSDTMVNWCPQLGTVLANDEVVGGLSVRGGYAVERKSMRQWSLRISAYAERLLQGLENIDWSDSIKEIQKNWIGKSIGAEINFHLSPALSKGEGVKPRFYTTNPLDWAALKDNAKRMRKEPTETENILWQCLRGNQLGFKIRRQQVVSNYIADFVCLSKKLIIEVDGKIHEQQKEQDAERTLELEKIGFEVIRFTNEEIINNIDNVIDTIKSKLESKVLSFGEDLGEVICIFTTRPDTIFGVTFMVLCPEHEIISSITTAEQKEAVANYLQWTKNRSERERQTEVNKITGVFTGAFGINPLTNQEIPIWISDYVLAGYGTGAIMAVPAHDSRDFAFARHFGLPIPQVILPTGEQAEDTANWKESKDSKEGTCINSGFITGMMVKDGIKAVIDFVEEKGIGKRMINYRLRDAIFSRQRYWGEPFPVYYKDGMPYMLDESKLPLELPAVDKYLPTESGEPPLARAENWHTEEGYPLECNTMPGFAGSSAYYLRYMDAHNDKEIFSKEANAYWQNVDLYIGGAEHATGHLIYARFWNKFLFDMGLCVKDEPFQKLINQGMIQGRSNFVYRFKGSNIFISLNKLLGKEFLTSEDRIKLGLDIPESNNSFDPKIAENSLQYNNSLPPSNEFKNELEDKYQRLHCDVNIVDNDILDIDKFRQWLPDYSNAEFILDNDGKYHCGWEVEKMSKAWFNVQNPDNLVLRYGADTLRMYEMFLGPLEQSKPWDTKGIEGVFRFIRKFWKLYHNENNDFCVTDEKASPQELKVLHRTIKKIQDDIERFSFNTAVSTFMICTNELTDLKCHKREILQPLAVLISPYAPHLAEELWHISGNNESITFAAFPELNEAYLVENTFNYPISFNGKTRFQMEFATDIPVAEIEKAVLAHPDAQKWLEGKAPKKVIIVPKKIVNIVI
ncbi:MAG: leucine--tRNA ligase [Bacteroidales bacterium]